MNITYKSLSFLVGHFGKNMADAFGDQVTTGVFINIFFICSNPLFVNQNKKIITSVNFRPELDEYLIKNIKYSYENNKNYSLANLIPQFVKLKSQLCCHVHNLCGSIIIIITIQKVCAISLYCCNSNMCNVLKTSIMVPFLRQFHLYRSLRVSI